MLAFWDNISYMVQLLAACLIFMIPSGKRNNFLMRIAVSGTFMIVLSYVVNRFCAGISEGIFALVYWAVYILACIIFVWTGLDGNFLQAVYCGICACGVQHITFDIYLIYALVIKRGGKAASWVGTGAGSKDALVSWVGNPVIIFMIYVVMYALFYFFFAKKLPEYGKFVVSRSSLFPIATIILLVWVLSILENSTIAGFEAGVMHRMIYRIIDGLCCFYVLWVQINQKENMALQTELDGINMAWRQQISQYKATSEAIESINRKCHDLKHQIRAIRNMTDEEMKTQFLDEIENDIMIYDTALNTGNKALDVVIMEKGLFCKTHGIQWSCMADGSRLDFMKLEDIYAFFGNALDNAVIAVMKLKDPMKRVIGVKILTQGNLLMIQIQNYYEGELRFEEGLPLTTSKNKHDHGFGMKSIRYTAEKYNGTITVRTEDHIFMLQVLIPVSESVV